MTFFFPESVSSPDGGFLKAQGRLSCYREELDLVLFYLPPGTQSRELPADMQLPYY